MGFCRLLLPLKPDFHLGRLINIRDLNQNITRDLSKKSKSRKKKQFLLSTFDLYVGSYLECRLFENFLLFLNINRFLDPVYSKLIEFEFDISSQLIEKNRE